MTTESQGNTTADHGPYSTEPDAPLDIVFDALATRPGRSLLRYLAEDSPDTVMVEDLAARIAADDADEARLRTRLHHTTLPKLDDADLLDYDADRKTVRYRSNCRLETVLSTLAESDLSDAAVSLDALFEVLADARRRDALLALVTHDNLSLPDLADEVAVAEHDRPLPEIDADTVLQVYLSLYHTHVPKITDADLAVYDQEGDLVALTDAGRNVESAIRALCATAATDE